jgi:hypothetical protein
MHICEQAIKAAKYLEENGFDQQRLSRIHHFSLKDDEITYARLYSYFSENNNLQRKNENFANRLIFIADSYRNRAGNFTELINSSLEQWPLA